ncbi:site-specific integrase [Mesorhizobium sp. B2-3-5]|uniref:tyrosine-type recombinase/integrase n=1 Tax=Mesorhizobium sp. B2-3-5 TaxID=2589958 RepID=UPI001128143E|nr:site-specific integrase [Mesorhizobium sp. B2-3-5]TPM36647.1 site-specific integrase [Mesorhizobium sp. B2-3-5]
MSDWSITRLRGGLALAFYRDGKRHRHSLGTSDPREAQRLAPAVYAELTRPQGRKIADLWEAYRLDKAAKSIATTMSFTGKAILLHFGHRDGEDITKAECDAYTAARRKLGRSDGAIHTELGHLRTVLVWALKKRLIGFAPEIERPKKPAPKDRHLTRDEAKLILAAATLPHVRLVCHLMLATAARISALLELTWDRVDFQRRVIYLTDPENTREQKGRANPPINNTLFAALQEARKGALSDYVVEWAGDRIKSVKKAIETAATKAGLEGVSPHVFRHTAAVWMAEAGVPIPEISQYLGHSNIAITYRVYARYSPQHLRKAASALELGIYEVPSGTHEPAMKNTG